MARRGWVDDRNFPGNSEERLNLALNLKEGLTPDGVFEDWGDHEGDYRIEDLDDSQASSRVEGEVGYSSPEEVQRYYDQLNSADLDIRILDEDSD